MVTGTIILCYLVFYLAKVLHKLYIYAPFKSDTALHRLVPLPLNQTGKVEQHALHNFRLKSEKGHTVPCTIYSLPSLQCFYESHKSEAV